MRNTLVSAVNRGPQGSEVVELEDNPPVEANLVVVSTIGKTFVSGANFERTLQTFRNFSNYLVPDILLDFRLILVKMFGNQLKTKHYSVKYN